MDKRIRCSDCPLCNVGTDELCEDYCSDMADFIDEIRADAIEEYTDWLFNEGYIGLHWNNPTNAIQNLLNKYKEQM